MTDLPIPGLPEADLPLSGSEVLPISQGGVAKKVSVSNLPQPSGQLDSNELDAVQNANAPTGANPFATVADINNDANAASVINITYAALTAAVTA